MSTRWMAVQYVGDTLRIPVANESDMDKPFGSSTLERYIKRIVVNPFSDSPQAFVPEAENAKLRELAKGLSWCSEERYLGHQESECPLYDERTDGKCRAEALMKELGIEVDDGTK